MTKSNIGKVFIGMVLMVGASRAGQWQFGRESTLVPAGPDATLLGVQTLRVHTPAASPDALTVMIDILDTKQQPVGHLIDTRATTAVTRGSAPEEMLVLSFQGRKVSLHYKDRAIWLSDGVTTATASFDQTDAADVERVKAFADDLRLIGELQRAAKTTIERASTATPTVRASVLDGFRLDRIARVLPRSWAAWLGGAPAGGGEAVCYTGPDHSECAGGFGASRSSGCAYAQQEANNECAAASGYCIGCCAWVGSGCDCACLFGDLACMCESCGGTCGPPDMAPAAAPAK